MLRRTRRKYVLLTKSHFNKRVKTRINIIESVTRLGYSYLVFFFYCYFFFLCVCVPGQGGKETEECDTYKFPWVRGRGPVPFPTHGRHYFAFVRRALGATYTAATKPAERHEDTV